MKRPLRQIREDKRSLLDTLALVRKANMPQTTMEYFRREYDAVSREYDLRMMLYPNV